MSWTRIAAVTFAIPPAKQEAFIDAMNELGDSKGWEGEFEGSGSEWGFTDQEATAVFFEQRILNDPDLKRLIMQFGLRRLR
jgi:hypothetical protein